MVVLDCATAIHVTQPDVSVVNRTLVAAMNTTSTTWPSTGTKGQFLCGLVATLPGHATQRQEVAVVLFRMMPEKPNSSARGSVDPGPPTLYTRDATVYGSTNLTVPVPSWAATWLDAPTAVLSYHVTVGGAVAADPSLKQAPDGTLWMSFVTPGFTEACPNDCSTAAEAKKKLIIHFNFENADQGSKSLQASCPGPATFCTKHGGTGAGELYTSVYYVYECPKAEDANCDVRLPGEEYSCMFRGPQNCIACPEGAICPGIYHPSFPVLSSRHRSYLQAAPERGLWQGFGLLMKVPLMCISVRPLLHFAVKAGILPRGRPSVGRATSKAHQSVAHVLQGTTRKMACASCAPQFRVPAMKCA